MTWTVSWESPASSGLRPGGWAGNRKQEGPAGQVGSESVGGVSLEPGGVGTTAPSVVHLRNRVAWSGGKQVWAESAEKGRGEGGEGAPKDTVIPRGPLSRLLLL